MRGRTIRLYLVDGTPGGVFIAEVANWTGKLFVAPRTQLAELISRLGARTGVYLLLGQDPDRSDKERVYIGETDNIVERLVNHDRNPKMSFWKKAIVIISTDENHTKSHVRYLESKLIEKARLAGRCRLTNGKIPPLPRLPEPEAEPLEYFLDQAQMILPILGFGFLEPKPSQERVEQTAISPQFVMSTIGAKATAIETRGEFVVLRGSTARKQGADSWVSYRSLRDQLVAEGKLIQSENPEFYTFNEDVPFSSPSAAATVVTARNTNGRTAWMVDETRTSYGQWQSQRIEQVTHAVLDNENA